MPVKSVKNQYRGINAHLHSFWQGESGWEGFHAAQLIFLAIALQNVLEPLGYQADLEKSLQVRRVDDRPKYPRADIRIDDLHPNRPLLAGGGDPTLLTGVVIPIMTAEIDAQPVDDEPYSAVAIYPDDTAQPPIAWIELLSPTNKHPNRDTETYLQKRANLVDAGIVFVELDYLHESPPTLGYLNRYQDRHAAQTRPYRIIVIDPRPNRREGFASINEFHVDEAIPNVTIPLSGSERILFDFDAPYQMTLTTMRYGIRKEANYAALPTHFKRYSAADQARIARRMLAVLEAARAGVDLETTTHEPDAALSLDAALERLQPLLETIPT
ncbi:MAG: DUF4058 family protein [Chloroflexota bacterium]|nr:DUF4058 family protein [Chloroflexota bacterium]